MSSALQQAEQGLLAEAQKGDGKRDDALLERLKDVVRTLQGTAGKRRRVVSSSDDDEEHVTKKSKRDADVEDRLRVLEEAFKQSTDMSDASEGDVTEVLRAVGLMEVRDEEDLEGPPDDFLCDGLDPFRMQDYKQETDTYEPFKEKLEACLKQEKGLIGKGGFQVAIVSNSNALDLEVGHRAFKCFLDLAIAPHASMGSSINQQMRLGLELKHTEEQKLAYACAQGQAGTRSNGEGDAQDPDLTGLRLTASPKAQATVQLLACCALAEHPMAIFLTDGMRYHKLHLRGEALLIRPDMQPRQAVYNMLQMLREAPKDPLFRLERHRDDPKMDQQAAASLKRLRQVQPSLREQAESVMAHLTNPTERLMEADAMIESWKRASGREECVPQWLAKICG